MDLGRSWGYFSATKHTLELAVVTEDEVTARPEQETKAWPVPTQRQVRAAGRNIYAQLATIARALALGSRLTVASTTNTLLSFI